MLSPRCILTAVLVPALGAAAVAQIQNEFVIFPERNGSSATYTSRPNIGAVEVFQEVPGKLFAGVGEGTRGCQVTGVWHWATDENPSTPETYNIVLRKPDSTGMLDGTPAGLIVRAGPFFLPTGGTVRAAWKVSANFATPIAIPCQGGFFMGVDLAAAPNWPATDGHSVWDARYSPPLTRPFGDNPRAGAPRHVWAVTAGVVSGPFDWVHYMGVLTSAPLLNMGGIDPANTRQSPAGSSNYAAGGMYPDIGGSPRSDGLDARIENIATPSGVAVLMLSVGITPFPPVSVGGIEGSLWLDPRILLTMGTGVITSGVATIPVASPMAISPALVGANIAFQAVMIDSGTLRVAFTNLQGVSF